jgi:hypothetical protein
MQTCIHSAFKDQKQKYHRGQKKDTVRIAQIDTAEILVNVQPTFGYRIKIQEVVDGFAASEEAGMESSNPGLLRLWHWQ